MIQVQHEASAQPKLYPDAKITATATLCGSSGNSVSTILGSIFSLPCAVVSNRCPSGEPRSCDAERISTNFQQ